MDTLLTGISLLTILGGSMLFGMRLERRFGGNYLERTTTARVSRPSSFSRKQQ